jgi:hypothetical protein
VLAIADPLAAGERQKQRAVEAARRPEVGILDNGRCLTQPGFAQTAGETPVLAACGFAVDEEAEPVLARQLSSIRHVLQFNKGIRHGGKAKRAKALDGRMDQHRISFGQ